VLVHAVHLQRHRLQRQLLRALALADDVIDRLGRHAEPERLLRPNSSSVPDLSCRKMIEPKSSVFGRKRMRSLVDVAMLRSAT
jgi:hypothetical protein